MGKRKAASAPPERDFQALWRAGRIGAVTAADADGAALRVRFPGWPNHGAGPDFTGALLQAPGGGVLRGDVELHRDAAGWRAHGHGLDPAYDAVAIHVVWGSEGSGTPACTTAAGRQVLTATADQPRPPSAVRDARPCTRLPREPDATARILDDLGDQRFLTKAASLAGLAETLGPDQALYQALLEALGYSKNREPFLALAERLPRATLAAQARPAPPERRRQVIEALLFGAAGLLPSQRGLAVEEHPWPHKLERLWRAAGLNIAGPPPVWTYHRVRPENAPARRIAAAAALLHASLEDGLARWLTAPLDAAQPPSPAFLQRHLAVTEEGYWASRWDFGRPLRPNPTILGGPRAADIAVNALLPFRYASAARAGDKGLAARCLALYRAHPPLGENQVTREMERLLLGKEARAVVTTARRQQGLLHLFKTRCFRLLCAGCSFAR